MKKVTVIINNKDLLTWPKAMCKEFERMTGLEEIIIVDNGSVNRALLQWYKECPYKVLFVENIGHTAPWNIGLIDTISTNFYVVTDPDLDLSDLPDDTLIHLVDLLEKNPGYEKVGVSLKTDDIPIDSPYFNHIQNYEAVVQKLSLNDEVINARVDTTLAVYDRRQLNSYKICGVRAAFPYVAKHIPWYVIAPDAEFAFYLRHANKESSSYKKFLSYDDSALSGEIEKIYEQRNSGKVSTKWQSYFSIYENWLHKFKNKPIALMEIGVQNGGSLEVWDTYFKNAQILVGCDVNPNILNLKFESNKIKLVCGAASSVEVYSQLLNINPNGFDVIVDDGSHRSLDTISNFLTYFPMLKPDGIFIVEDMHCAYWPEYEGGFFNQRSAGNFFKLLFDLVNIEHCRSDFTVEQLFQTFLGINQVPQFLKDGSVYSISTYNSVYVIQKSGEKNKPFLGECVVAGDCAEVDDRVLGIKK